VKRDALEQVLAFRLFVQLPYDAHDAHEVDVTESYTRQVYSGSHGVPNLGDDILDLIALDRLTSDVSSGIDRDFIVVQAQPHLYFIQKNQRHSR